MLQKAKIDIGPLVSWMKMSQKDVLRQFMTLEGAYMDGRGDSCFVYVPGHRKDKALLVAHADTVFGENYVPKIGLESGVLFSLSHKDDGIRRSRGTKEGSKMVGTGLGADDRAGCAIIWKLRELGHSILITSGEEIGQIAAHAIMENKWWKEEIAKHQFAVQFDRKGYKDIVFYQCGTTKFEDYVKEETGYKVERGSRTDICVLCKDICGVNISVGYYNEHTKDEILVIDQWHNTYLTARKWLSQSNIPRFPLDKPVYTNSYSGRQSGWQGNGYDDEFYGENTGPWYGGSKHGYGGPHSAHTLRNKVKSALLDGPSHLLKCSVCKKSSPESNWIALSYSCPHCKISMRSGD